MKPVEEAELSALLDGELDAVRARQIEARMAEDPALRRAFEALASADAAWRTAAGAAAFSPQVRLPDALQPARDARSDRSGWLTALFIAMAALVGLRSVLKLGGSEALAVVLPVLSLLLLVAVVLQLTRDEGHGGAIAHPGETPS